MCSRKITKNFLVLLCIAVICASPVFAQEGDGDTAERSPENGEAVPDDGTASYDEADEDQSARDDESQEQDEPRESTQPRRRSGGASRRLRLLDAHGPDFTDSRIPEYTVPDDAVQILADVDEPELQDGDLSEEETKKMPADTPSETTDDESSDTIDDESSGTIENTINSMDYTIRNIIAWGSLFALLLLMVILYRYRTGRKRKRVFRKIPSKRR